MKQKFKLKIMNKKQIKQFLGILVLIIGLQLNAQSQNYAFIAHQDSLLLHCDETDSTYVFLTLSDPNGELTGPFTVQWTVNSHLQSESGFVSTDTLHWRDTVVYEVFDVTTTSVWLDSLYIQDEAKPHLMIYPGYQVASHYCYGTGKTKLQVPMPYIMENVWVDDPNATLADGNHVEISNITKGTHTYSYNINTCKYYEELVINSLPKPELQLDQLVDASECGKDGKLNLMLSDSLMIDSLWLSQGSDTIRNDTIMEILADAGHQTINLYAKSCFWEEDFYVESEDPNEVETIEIKDPTTTDFADGHVVLYSKYPIIRANLQGLNGEKRGYYYGDKMSGRDTIRFDSLASGYYEVYLESVRNCWTTVHFELTKPDRDYVTYSTDAISPNGDGKNDVINIVIPEESEIHMKIFPYHGRSNTLVYETEKNVWDGKNFEGEIIPDGWYLLDINVILPDGRVIHRKKVIKKN
ncbi:MAG: hypothetical protein GXP45_04560 [bacterium]|nr:hypothetical protein [bacterium]